MSFTYCQTEDATLVEFVFGQADYQSAAG
jgi:hypothetical protein